MRVVTRSLLDTLLIAMSRLPGRKALLLVPAAVLYGRLDPEFLKSRADSTAHAMPPSQTTVVATRDQQLASGPNAPSGGLAAMMSKILGPNDFASGGLMLMLIGAAAAGARSAVNSGLRYCRRAVMVTAEIDSRDDAYRWVMHWLSQHPKFRNSTMVSVTTNLNCFGTAVAQWPLGIPDSSSSSSSSGEISSTPVSYLPAPGDHLFRYQGRWMKVSRTRDSTKQTAANARLLLETMTISMFGTNRSALDALLSEAAASYHQSQSSRTAIHSYVDGYWAQVGSRPIRPITTVVLPQGQAESLLSDCREFLASEEWYAHHGIPYRRGYLLYGPPGTGKTSLVMAVAGALGLDIYVITLSSPSMTDETFRQLLNTASADSVLLLEDVDAAFLDRAAAGGAASSRLTFSGLLNAIDGVAAQEGRLLFMTTNHIERLSSALIRPGRVDVRYYLGPATLQQARDLFVSFYQDLPHLLLQPLAAQKAAATKGTAAAAAAAVGPRPEGDSVAAAAVAAAKAAATANQPQQPPEQQSQQQQQQRQRRQPQGLLTQSGSKSRSSAAQEAAAREVVLHDLAIKFADQLPEESGISMAQLQGYLMTYRKDPWGAAANVQQLLQQQQQQAQQQQEQDDESSRPTAD